MDITPVTGGMERIWASDDIAIVVLFMCLVFAAGLIVFLLRHIFGTKDVLASIQTSLTLLNEKLDHD